MLMILIDAFVLMALLKLVSDEDIGFGTAVLVGLLAALGVFSLVIALGMLLGLVGVLLAVVLGAAGLGVAISAMFGIEIKRSIAIGVIFLVLHVAISAAISSVFAA